MTLKRRCRTLACLLAALCVAPLAARGAAARQSDLERRARALLNAWPEARTDFALRDELLAVADTLEIAESFVLQAECLGNAGITCYYLGDLERAIATWSRQLDAARRSEDPKAISSALNAMAVGVSASGDHERAVGLFEDLVHMRRTLGDVRGEAVATFNLSQAYERLYLLPEALDALSSAARLHLASGNTLGVANTFINRAGVVFRLGRSRTALSFADSAIALTSGSNLPGAQGIRGRALGAKAYFFDNMGLIEPALAHYDSATAILEDEGEVESLLIVRGNRMNALVQAGRYDDALTRAHELLPVFEERGDEMSAIITVAFEGAALLGAERTTEAERRLIEAIERLEAHRTSLSDDRQLAALGHASHAYTDLALLYHRQGRSEDAWRVAESGTAALLSRDLAAGAREQARVDLASLQSRLASVGAALIQLSEKSHELVAFVVDGRRVVSVEISLPRTFSDDVRNALYMMSTGQADTLCLPPLRRISRAVLAPVEPFLDEDAKRIVFVPGSALAGLPIEPLPSSLGDGSGDFGERYPVSYAPSATAWYLLGGLQVADHGMLVFADPTVSKEQSGQSTMASRVSAFFGTPLPEARAEAGDVATPAARVLLGSAATKAAFFAAGSRGAAVVHFATHAMVDPLHSRGSALLLAGGARDDQLLTVREVEASELRTDLVSLSGCATATGYTYPGEGTYGFARAFHVAGARSVVMSMWDVEDAAARAFMRAFYAALRAGEPRDRALQLARGELAREGYPHRDRSAFVLSGVGADPVALLAAAGDHGPLSALAVVGLVLAAVVSAAVGYRLARARRTQPREGSSHPT